MHNNRKYCTHSLFFSKKTISHSKTIETNLSLSPRNEPPIPINSNTLLRTYRSPPLPLNLRTSTCLPTQNRHHRWAFPFFCLSEPIRANQSLSEKSDTFLLVLINSDKFRYPSTNIPPAPNHLLPPPYRPFTTAPAHLPPHSFLPTPPPQRTFSTTPAHFQTHSPLHLPTF